MRWRDALDRCLRRVRAAAWGCATALAAAAASANPLPPEVVQALQRARVPAESMAIVVQQAGSGTAVLQHEGQQLVNPASLTKLVTTYAALDLLGPAWTWRTPVWLDGPVRDGALEGSLVIRGSGDPTLTVERALLLNYKAVTYRFTPDAARGVAVVGMEPRLDGVSVPAEVPLARGACGDWRGALKASLAEPERVRFD